MKITKRSLTSIALIFILMTITACSLPILLSPPAETQANPSGQLSLSSTATTAETTGSILATETRAATTAAQEAVLLPQESAEQSETPKYTIHLQYPYLEWNPQATADTFNERIDTHIADEVTAFKANVNEVEEWRLQNMPGASSDLDVSYAVTYQEGNLISLLFTIDFYLVGAAHPGQYSHAFNFDLDTGKFLDLSNGFLPGSDYLQRIAYYCTDALDQSGNLQDPQGAAALEDNYRIWNIQPDGLLISFDTYQVAPGAAGRQQVLVPYSILKDIIDAQGPLASVSLHQ
jgi:hypothetical protein